MFNESRFAGTRTSRVAFVSCTMDRKEPMASCSGSLFCLRHLGPHPLNTLAAVSAFAHFVFLSC